MCLRASPTDLASTMQSRAPTVLIEPAKQTGPFWAGWWMVTSDLTAQRRPRHVQKRVMKCVRPPLNGTQPS